MTIEKAGRLIEIKKITQKSLREYLGKQYDQLALANAPIEVMKMIQMESKGGKCQKCGKPWKKITVKNIFADFEYYNPDCKCYPICEKQKIPVKDDKGKTHYYTLGCGAPMYRESVGEITECQSCGFDPKKVNQSDNTGVSDYERRYLKR